MNTDRLPPIEFAKAEAPHEPPMAQVRDEPTVFRVRTVDKTVTLTVQLVGWSGDMQERHALLRRLMGYLDGLRRTRVGGIGYPAHLRGVLRECVLNAMEVEAAFVECVVRSSDPDCPNASARETYAVVWSRDDEPEDA